MDYSKCTTDELLKYCKLLYKKNGIEALSYKNLPSKLYFQLYSRNITQKKLIEIFGLEKEYKIYKSSIPLRKKNGKNIYVWSWQRVVDQCSKIVKKEGFLPPPQWFQENSLGGIVQAVYNLGKTWGDLRDEFKSYENSTFVRSRNGLRWLSHPEASLSNFLYARGIRHSKGRRYPKDYSQKTGLAYGMYDLEFIDSKGNKIFVEIWGEKPNGHAKDRYEYKKKLKENYNLGNKYFLGINFRDCYNEKRLEKILTPFIGIIKPFVFEKSYDEVIPSTNWSNADELISFCKEFAKKQPNGIFPTEEWLRKRGKWKNREGEAYNTLAVYIKKWIGGIRKLREIIGQPENSTMKWDRDIVILEYKKWMEKYNKTPGSIRSLYNRNKIKISKKEFNRACCLEAAIRKYLGGMEKLKSKL